MPSPKAFLRDIVDYGLDPSKSYTKDHVTDGRVKPRVETPAKPNLKDPHFKAEEEPVSKKVGPSGKRSALKKLSSSNKVSTVEPSKKSKATQDSISETATLRRTSSDQNNVEHDETKAVQVRADDVSNSS